MLEQGECKADVYVSQAEDLHSVSDSVAESDEECPGAGPQTARCAWVMPERHSLRSSHQRQQLLVAVDA